MKSTNIRVYPQRNPWANLHSARPLSQPGRDLGMDQGLCLDIWSRDPERDPFFVDDAKIVEKESKGEELPKRRSRSTDKARLTRESKQLCNGTQINGVVIKDPCPIREACFSYAFENHIDFGVWGGFTSRERRKLRKKQQEAVRNNARGTGQRDDKGKFIKKKKKKKKEEAAA